MLAQADQQAMRGEGGGVLKKAACLLMTTDLAFLLFSSSLPSLPPPAAVPLRRVASSSIPNPSVAMADAEMQPQKRALRTQIRRALKAVSPAQRAQEDSAIQNFVLDSSWFQSSKGLCAYLSCETLREVDTSRIIAEVLKMSDAELDMQIKKSLYVPRVEDKNSHMRMLKISTINDLVANSMNILEPSPIDAAQNAREDVMLANQPVDLLLLPGLAFDRQGRRLGRGGGYYDVFLKKYEELANQRKWKQPLRVALAYSVQILEENVIPMSPTDIPVDALVTANGVIAISSSARERL
ncbi:5-formyltetrahydrofolate cyclo-ligase, mitochondrial-like [Zingiber officinale]|uniref:5-formyltetrahydrofolate cyclo-ligase, mitochondrial-like n=1 Tax=Zingiber officinale TaxID=94328 RepID=UPI001C4C75D4|nr:5-formyltetrahydrofolate cyclo-ligase, mitochondrial-like [Zingiber officinale]